MARVEVQEQAAFTLEGSLAHWYRPLPAPHHTAPYHLPPHNTAHPSTRGSGGGAPGKGGCLSPSSIPLLHLASQQFKLQTYISWRAGLHILFFRLFPLDTDWILWCGSQKLLEHSFYLFIFILEDSWVGTIVWGQQCRSKNWVLGKEGQGRSFGLLFQPTIHLPQVLLEYRGKSCCFSASLDKSTVNSCL